MKVAENWTERGSRDYPEYLAAALNGQWNKDTLCFLAGFAVPRPGVRSAPQETRDAATKAFLRTLRGLVDHWIATGRENDAENPWQRNVTASTPDYPQPIIKTLADYRDRNPPRVGIQGDGRFLVFPDLMRSEGWPTPEPNLEATLQRARDFAVSEFLRLLESSGRERLFRCDNCGAYFVRLRTPKKDLPIKKGTFCENCAGRGGARRMGETRAARQEAKLKAAAEAWLRWNYSHRHPDQREWVAREVSKRCGVEIQRNWVSRNLVEILKRAEALKNAKG